MPSGEGQFPGVVLGTVVEADGGDHVMMLLRPVKGRDGIRAT